MHHMTIRFSMMNSFKYTVERYSSSIVYPLTSTGQSRHLSSTFRFLVGVVAILGFELIHKLHILLLCLSWCHSLINHFFPRIVLVFSLIEL